MYIIDNPKDKTIKDSVNINYNFEFYVKMKVLSFTLLPPQGLVHLVHQATQSQYHWKIKIMDSELNIAATALIKVNTTFLYIS